jgi:hypothetical protein
MLKGILSTKIVIFIIPKIIVVFRTDLHKMKIKQKKIRFVFFFFDKKDPKLSLSELLSRMTRIQINPPLFIWPSMWTRLEHAKCLEAKNNMSEERADFDGFREKEEYKYSIFQMEQMQDIWRGLVGALERTEGSATRLSSRWSGKDFAWYTGTCSRPFVINNFNPTINVRY